MLSHEENDLITQTGPGTPMGELMRQYWIPALLSSELQSDGDPVRVLLLGEKLIAFRDGTGKVGLLADACPHRGASLWFGRNEECGLRCVYHGWKFDTAGNCVDMPNEPAESNFKHKVKATAYPCLERGGLVWAYLGPRATPPPLPDLEANMLPDGEWTATAIQRECNWLQAMEGDIDVCHFGFLHGGGIDPETQAGDTFSYYVLKDRAPRYSVVELEAGAVCGTYRPAGEGKNYWRVGHFLFPFFTIPGQGVLGNKIAVRAWVPMDDEHTMFFMCGPASRRGFAVGAAGNARSPLLPQGTGWLDRFRMSANARNDYEIDRERQRQLNAIDSFTGIKGIHLQDQAVTESMGPVYDRSKEHLGTSDVLIIKVRRQLVEAARALRDQSATPPGVDSPDAYRVRSGGLFLQEGADWIQETAELRKAFVSHPELNIDISGAIV